MHLHRRAIVLAYSTLERREVCGARLAHFRHARNERMFVLPVMSLLYMIMYAGQLALLGGAARVPAHCATIWVDATAGSDANDGCARTTALRSIDAAQTAARQQHVPTTVRLKGRFELRDQGLVLTHQDRGITWSGVWDEGARVNAAVITGGASVPPDAWEPITGTGPLDLQLSAPLPVGAELLRLDLARTLPDIHQAQVGTLTRHGFTIPPQSPPMQLFGRVAGKLPVRARWPKPGAPALAMSLVRNPNKTRPVFDINSTRPRKWNRSWSSPGGVWLDGILSQNWVWTFNRAQRLSNGSYTLASPEVADPTTQLTYCCHNRFAFVNVFEELSEIGEYYVNETEMTVFLVSPSNGPRPKLSVSILNSPLIQFSAGATNITVRQLNLTVGRASAIDAHLGDHVKIENVDVCSFGLNGVQLGANSTLVSADLYDLGGYGVNMFGDGHPATLTPGNSHVLNSRIRDWAQWQRVYTPAVVLGGVANSVQHCQIEGGPHSSITLYGNDNTFAYNTVSKPSQEFNDMGAIYMNLGPNPLNRGNVIHSNFFHDIGEGRPLIQAVYADDGSMGLTVHSNIFHRVACGETCHAVHGNGASYVNVTNNIFVDCAGPYEQSDKMMHSTQYEHLVPHWKATFAAANASGMLATFLRRYPELRDFWTEDRRSPKSNIFSKAVVYNPSVMRGSSYDEISRNFSSRGFACGGCASSDIASKYVWLADADPGFADISRMNFSLPTAAVRGHIPEWQHIDFDAIGPTLGCVGSVCRND